MSEKSQRLEAKKRTLVCENSQFHIFFDELSAPGQLPIPDYLVVAPKRAAADLITGVAILPVCGGKLGLIRAYRHPIGRHSWEIPRGFVDAAETTIAAAMRELNEETGLECQAENMRPLGFMTPDTGILAARVQLFAALDCDRSRDFAAAEWGHEQFRLFASDEVAGMISKGELQDPSTLIAFFLHARR